MLGIIHALTMAIAFALSLSGGTLLQAMPPDPEPAQPPPITVRLTDNRFRPARLTIPAGTTVIWSNEELDPAVEHNVISRDYRWASSNFLPGETYERTFTTAGAYRYFCDLHGGMTGTITVE